MGRGPAGSARRDAGEQSLCQRQRGRLLFVTFSAIRLPFPAGNEPVIITTLRRWLDSWTSLGLIATGMARQGYALELARYGEEGWRATFFPAGRAHSPTADVGTAWERTPWRAVQGAAWEMLWKSELLA